MIPEILEIQDNRIIVTPQAYMIPETKAILDKHDLAADPYLGYVRALSHPQSAYINMAEEDMVDSAIYDIKATMGDFDPSDPLIQPAIDKLKSYYTTTITMMAEELEEEIHRHRRFLRDTAISERNMKDRQGWLEKIDKIVTSYNKVRDQANKEIGQATKGDHEVGGYFE